MSIKRWSVVLVLSFSLVLIQGPVLFGEEFPARPIKIIVPFNPGGVGDLTWRAMSEPMLKVLGQPIVIENKPGGGGSLGYTLTAGAKPDGYTLGHISLGSFINNYLTYDVSYNPASSYTYIGGIARLPQALIVRANAPWKTWEEFADYSKKHPSELTMGYSGAASATTIAIKWAAKKLGIKWKEIVCQGDVEGITALLGGNIDAFPGAGPQNMMVKDGRAKMLLALTVDPIPGFAQVPTFGKIFGKECLNAAALAGPAGIPKPILEKLERAVYEGVKDPAFVKTAENIHMIPMYRNNKEFTQDINETLKNYQVFLKDLDMLKKK